MTSHRYLCGLAAAALTFSLLVPPATATAEQHSGQGGAVREAVSLGKPGDKIPLGNGHYFVFSFDKPPKIGSRIVKVEVFTKEGKKDNSFEVKGEMDMPSMRGAHASGPQPFKLSKRGDYLLPVSLVMPGDWELTLIFLKSGKAAFTGRYLFKI